MDFSFNGHQLRVMTQNVISILVLRIKLYENNEVNLIDILCLIMIHKIYFLMKSICNAHVKTWEIYSHILEFKNKTDCISVH